MQQLRSTGHLTHQEISFNINHAGVAELADALDLGSSGAIRRGSTPLFRTTLPYTEEVIILFAALLPFPFFSAASTASDILHV